ncbi:hypothetical protein FACS1894122_04400 [Alphaproteobacteria bacterium]|nr:hypothetical protein FACS1894122_04400 [Alphaproteobacteria bacterium]
MSTLKDYYSGSREMYRDKRPDMLPKLYSMGLIEYLRNDIISNLKPEQIKTFTKVQIWLLFSPDRIAMMSPEQILALEARSSEFEEDGPVEILTPDQIKALMARKEELMKQK